jgi:hypothetical protein
MGVVHIPGGHSQMGLRPAHLRFFYTRPANLIPVFTRL